MKIISRDTYKIIPAFVIVILATLGILFLFYIIFQRNGERPISIDMILGLLFLSWIVIIPLTLLIPMFRSVELLDDRLKVNYLFGLIIHEHFYTRLKLGKYFYHKGNGLVVENDNGQQMTFGEKEYKNYHEVKGLLENKIARVEKIELRYVSKTMIIMLILFGLTLLCFIISIRK